MLLRYFHRFFNRFIFFVFFFLFLGFFIREHVFALTRSIPVKTQIPVPSGAVTSGSCPTNLLPNHISICGIAKTIDINMKGKVEYAQEPIKGVTVAAYLGVKYANLGPLSNDPNNTGELVGNIERLYTYDVSNVDGRFILPVPKGIGTNGFVFLAFFCGDRLKDLYMIDTSQDLPYMPVSLACPPVVSPSTINAIPAPPSITYANRTSYTSCEDDFKEGDPGEIKESQNTVELPLEELALDDTRKGATAEVDVTYRCEEVVDTAGHCQSPADCISCYGTGVEGQCGTTYTSQPCPDLECSWVPPQSHYKVIQSSIKYGTPVFNKTDVGGGHILEYPPASPILSRRDLEGFTHTSMGYSPQAISSLNCGISGCYYTGPPAMGKQINKYLDPSAVEACNTEPFTPLNCWGPGIQLAEPGEYEKSYSAQGEVVIYEDGTTLNDITQPQYSSLGQLIQGILAAFNINITVTDADTPNSIINKIINMFGDVSGNDATIISFQNVKISFDSFLTAFDAYQKETDTLEKFKKAGAIVLDSFDVVKNFFIAVGNVETIVAFDLLNEDAKYAFAAITNDIAVIYNSFSEMVLLLPDFNAIGEKFVSIVTSVEDIRNQLLVFLPRLDDLFLRVKQILGAIDALRNLKLTTVDSRFFPYSTVLNYNINKRFRETYLNRPINDSFKNLPWNSPLCLNSPAEGARMDPSIGNTKATLPFNACYGAFLLGEDTYSTQKALYTTTKNTAGKVADVNNENINDPVVSKFLGPKEPVGVEVSPKADALVVDSVANTPKVGGRGYWRLGVIQTMCSAGQNDYDSFEPTTDPNKNVIDYPVMAVFGQEGAKWATGFANPRAGASGGGGGGGGGTTVRPN
jgi:hypothetical protein